VNLDLGFGPPGLPALAAALALLAAGLLLWVDRRGEPAGVALLPMVVLAPLAAGLGSFGATPRAFAPLAALLVAALLARDREDRLHSECALKLLWVAGPAFALAWAGEQLLAVLAGTAVVREQWAVLALGLDPPMLWGAALPLSMLAGLVLVGGAPFHFWSADLVQGARAWVAPLAVAVLQASGALWLERRLEGVEAFDAGSRVVSGLCGIAAIVAFVAGGVTLAWQRRPERRVGTLASLHGALVLGSLAAAHHTWRALPPPAGVFEGWAAHLALGLTGAVAVSRLRPVGDGVAPPAPLFRRHPMAGVAGLYAMASLAGVPGTPGAELWLEVARRLIAAGRSDVLIAMGFAWIAAFSVTIRIAREAFGTPTTEPPPERPVPLPVRAALWIAAAGLIAAWPAGGILPG
jgi:NADH-quinone oxidoreductase subunit N